VPGYLKIPDGREYHVGEALPPIECLRCGICCTRHQPPLSPEEVEATARNLKMTTSDFLTEYVQITLAGYLLRHDERGCVFLNREAGQATATCRIHPFRPEACRNWIPSLSRPECQEGLMRLQSEDNILLPDE